MAPVCEHCRKIKQCVKCRQSDEMLCNSCDKIRAEIISKRSEQRAIDTPLPAPGADELDMMQDTSENAAIDTAIAAAGVPNAHVANGPQHIHCIPSCQNRNKRSLAIVRCQMCMKDHHRKCLTDYRENHPYACTTCRLFPAQIASLLSDMTQLRTDMSTLKQTNTELNTKLNSTENKYTELIQINTDLRAAVGQITHSISSEAWQSFRNSAALKANKTLLIGSSIIRDVDEAKIENVEVRSYSGATVKEIHTEMRDIKNKYEKVIIVAGGNDCDTNGDGRDISDVIVDYRELITDCKKLAPEVSVATVCPRLKGLAVTERIDALNVGLQVLCSDESCALLDNEATFKLGNGAINDGYILKKCKTHLTYAGTNSLVKNLGLKPKPGCEDDICARKPASRGNQTNHTNHQETSEKPAHQPQGGYVHSGRGRYVRSNHGRSTGFHQESTGSRPPRHNPGGGHSADRRRLDDDKDTTAPRRDMRHHARSPGSPSRHHGSQSRNERGANNNGTSGDWHTVHSRSRHRSGSKTPGQSLRPGNRNSCGFCGERNHRQDTCWHAKPVTCDSCKGPGHKSKHHDGH